MKYPSGIEASYQRLFGSGRRGGVRIIAFFDKAALMDAVPENGPVESKFLGRLKTDQYFYGSDTIRIIGRCP